MVLLLLSLVSMWSLFCVTPVCFAIVLPPKTVMQSVSLAILWHEYGVKPSGIFEKSVDITGLFGDIRDKRDTAEPSRVFSRDISVDFLSFVK